MIVRIRHTTLRQIGFASFFNLLFFLPYLGQTRFRVDQFIGFLAIGWLAQQALINPPEASRAARFFFKWGLLIIGWVAILSVITPGSVINGLQFVNSFSSLAGGIAIFILVRENVRRDLRVFLFVTLGFSILINVLAFHLWQVEDNAFVRQFLDLYGGAHDESYGEAGTLGAVSQLGGRIASVFPHSQAFAVYNLMILAIGSYTIYLCRSWATRSLCVVAVLMSLVGGILSSSKTYTFCLLIMLAAQAAFALPKFLKHPRLNFIYGSVLFLVSAVIYGFYEYNRFLRDQMDVIWKLDWAGLISTRLGENGYLIKSGTVDAMLQPAALTIGMGQEVSGYAWSDNGYFQVLMFGGIPFFICFFGYFFYLMRLFKAQRTQSGNAFFALYIALLFGNSGMLIYLFPRSGLLLAFFTMVALEHDYLLQPELS